MTDLRDARASPGRMLQLPRGTHGDAPPSLSPALTPPPQKSRDRARTTVLYMILFLVLSKQYIADMMRAGYVQPLKRLGLVPIRIPAATADLFESTLQEFSSTKKFRFPPQEGATAFDAWPENYRHSYFKLERIARDCYFGLLNELTGLKNSKFRLDPCLLKKDTNFETSFMNIFNYQYGYLKPHRDRCLVTIVYRQFIDSPVGPDVVDGTDLTDPNTKILWSHDINVDRSDQRSRWINVDNALCSKKNQVCMFIGEEMSALCGNFVSPNEHCVTENPNFPYTADSKNISNRMSLALVLSAPTISAYIENNKLIN